MAKQLKSKAGAAPRRKRRSAGEVLDRIIAAAEQEFETCGYSGATTAAIAQRAEVTETQIFRHFASKEDLFRAAVFNPLNRHFSEFMAGTIADLPDADDSRDRARHYINELQDFMEQHSRTLMSLVVVSAYESESADGVKEMEGLRTYFERGAAIMKSRVGDDPRVDPKLMVRVSFAAVLASVMFKDWLFPRGIGSAKAIREAIADFVIDGISANDALTKSLEA